LPTEQGWFLCAYVEISEMQLKFEHSHQSSAAGGGHTLALGTSSYCFSGDQGLH
jgi:hypothetical protein